jgi:DNA-binding SARP family transcriptional activator
LATIRVRLFGKLSVRHDEHELASGLSPKAQELLAYLLVFRRGLHSRERLACEMWPDASALEARSRLRRLLWKLQHEHGEGDDSLSKLLKVDSGWIGINPAVDLWLDHAIIEETFHEIGRVNAATLTAEQAEDLQQALDLAAGELLGGWYDDWCIAERERMHVLQLSLLTRLAEHYISTRQVGRGLATVLEILRIDPAHEVAHRQAILLYCMTGDRTRALRQFHTCETALRRELGVSPERSTIELYRKIRDEDLSFDRHPPIRLSGRKEAHPSLEEIHARMDELQSIAIESHNQMRQQLHHLRNSILRDSS